MNFTTLQKCQKAEIIKAYSALQWHPDNFQNEEERKKLKKFIDIAAARSLSDPGSGCTHVSLLLEVAASVTGGC